MKTKILIIALLITPIFNTFSQTPIIQDFRKIIAEAPSHFNTLQTDLFQENDGYKFYHSSIEASPISTVYIQTSEEEVPIYVIDFNVEAMSAQMIGLFMNMVEQYIDEINEMVKSGQYTGEDFNTEDGRSITEIRNLNNDIVVQYLSNSTNHSIYFFGLPK